MPGFQDPKNGNGIRRVAMHQPDCKRAAMELSNVFVTSRTDSALILDQTWARLSFLFCGHCVVFIPAIGIVASNLSKSGAMAFAWA